MQCTRQRKAAPRAQKDIEAASVLSCVQSSSATLINDGFAEKKPGSRAGQWFNATLEILAAPILVTGLAIVHTFTYLAVKALLD